jgi:hypothetical protein
VHWQRLHAVADEARERVSKAYVQMEEIDRNADLSHDGKHRQRRETAAKAVADFEASKTLARAHQAVELAVAKNNLEHHVRDATRKATFQLNSTRVNSGRIKRMRGVLAGARCELFYTSLIDAARTAHGKLDQRARRGLRFL